MLNSRDISSRESLQKTNLAPRTSYKIVHKTAERGNFRVYEGRRNDLCPDKADLFGTISLLANSVVHRTWGEYSVTDASERYELLVVLSGSGWVYWSTSTSQISCSFMVLIWTFRSQKNWHPFAAFSWKCRKLCKAITFSGLNIDVL